MKKLLLTFFFLFFSSSSNGEWQFAYKQSNGYDIYLDFQSVKLHESFVYWNELVNFTQPLAGIMSMLVYMKGDCVELKQKTIQFKYFSKHFGEGFIKLSSSNSKKWVIINKQTVPRSTLEQVCKSINIKQN